MPSLTSSSQNVDATQTQSSKTKTNSETNQNTTAQSTQDVNAQSASSILNAMQSAASQNAAATSTGTTSANTSGSSTANTSGTSTANTTGSSNANTTGSTTGATNTNTTGLTSANTAAITNETVNPWAPQEQSLNYAFDQAKNAYGQAQGAQGPDNFVAQFTPDQLAVFNKMMGATGSAETAGGAGAALSTAGANSTAAGLNDLGAYTPKGGTDYNINAAGQYADNPYISGAVDAAMRDASRAVSEQALPQIGRNAALTGNVNSSKRAISEGIVQRGLAEKTADVSANMRNSAYNNGLTLAQNEANSSNDAILKAAMARVSGGNDATATGTSALTAQNGLFDTAAKGASGVLSGNQAALDEQAAKYNFDTKAPFEALNNYYDIIGDKSWGTSSSGVAQTDTDTTTAAQTAATNNASTQSNTAATNASNTSGTQQSQTAGTNSSNTSGSTSSDTASMQNAATSQNSLQQTDQSSSQNTSATANQQAQTLLEAIVKGNSTGASAQNTTYNPSLLSSIGQGASILGSIMSDRRVKSDIHEVGELWDGQPVYRYYYTDDPSKTVHIGLMAQDVEKTKPDAVVTINGVKHVNYDLATREAVMS